VLPVLFLVIFASLFHADTVKVAGGSINTSIYYVPGIITLGIIAAAFVNLVISVTAQRETGALKRRRATPVPAIAIIAGRALTSVVVALGITALLLAIGWLFYKAAVPGRTFPALVVTVIVGALAFCCLGFALASVVRNQDSAQPITQATMLPLYFISGVFIFPVRHLAAALLTAYNPHTTGAGFAGTDLLVVALWGIAGLVIALWRFSWVPLSR
jgi:ABC-2 type transport system permease protein